MIDNEFLVVESTQILSDEQFEQLRQYGFCYMKIDNNTESMLKHLTLAAKNFFRQPEAIKEQYKFDNQRGGYMNHKQREEDVQRYFWRSDWLPEQLSPHLDELNKVKDTLKNSLALPVLKQLFDKIEASSHYREVTHNCDTPFSFVYYPYCEHQVENRLKAHHDVAMFTVLYIQEKGLDVEVNGAWHEIHYKPGHVLINFGKTLELMSGGKLPAVYHRVNLSEHQERISVAFFIGPNPDIPLIDYTTNTQKYSSFGEFFVKEYGYLYPDFLP